MLAAPVPKAPHRPVVTVRLNRSRATHQFERNLMYQSLDASISEPSPPVATVYVQVIAREGESMTVKAVEAQTLNENTVKRLAEAPPTKVSLFTNTETGEEYTYVLARRVQVSMMCWW